MKNRTLNTLFMLSSVDGKISTGSVDNRDVDKDFPKIRGIKEGLSQYYEIEKKTDIFSLNTGKVMAKIGINKKQKNIKKLIVRFVIIDSKPYLTKTGVNNLLKKCKTLYLITTNKKHPAFKIKDDNIKIIYYSKKINFYHLFETLKKKYKANRVTIQSGGTLNSILLRNSLIDRISIVVAPALIGGKDTPSLVDGKSLFSEKDLKNVKALKLKKVKRLKHSYLHLVYEVLN